MAAYYNEHDVQKAAWLRELMRQNLIAAGEVDERSIEEVQPDDLGDFDQCHWFAGIGVWSYALRNAGWSDSSSVWTGSCPCPSFSSSGKGEGFSDPRHLWPAWFRLIEVCRPHVIFGEQVASESALAWLDLVSSDLEGADYAIGAADLCAAGVGAPHIRQRLYFVADSISRSSARVTRVLGANPQGQSIKGNESAHGCGNDALALPKGERCGEAGPDSGRPTQRTSAAGEPSELGDTALGRTEGASLNRESRASGESQEPLRGSSLPGIMGDTSGRGLEGRVLNSAQQDRRERNVPRSDGAAYNAWGNIEWLPCRDGKARPVEPGTFPLAHGSAARVVRLRGYGDAIVATLAQAFIEAYTDIRGAA